MVMLLAIISALFSSINAFDIKESMPVKFSCGCSKDKILNMLAALSKDDIDYLTEQPDTEVHCQYCNKVYHFSSEELKQLKTN